MTIRLLAISGSSRQGSLNKQLLDAAINVARTLGADVTLIDLRALALPIYDGDLETTAGLPDGCVALKQALAGHDALLLASPEYNGFFTAPEERHRLGVTPAGRPAVTVRRHGCSAAGGISRCAGRHSWLAGCSSTAEQPGRPGYARTNVTAACA